MNRDQLIEIIKQTRLSRGITQAQLADAIGTDRSNIVRIETGKRPIGLDTLLRIAEALGLTLKLE